MQYAPFFYGFLPLRYKYCPKHQFSKASALCYSLRATNQISYPPYKLQTQEHFCLFGILTYTAQTQHLIQLGAHQREKFEKGNTVRVWTTKKYMGSRRNTPPILHFGSERRWATYCTSWCVVTFLTLKNAGVLWVWGRVGPEPVWTILKKRQPIVTTGIWTVDGPVRRQSL
jgi:hypothetical protein